MFKLLSGLCAAIFVTLLVAGRDDGQVRHGLVPGKVAPLMAGISDEPGSAAEGAASTEALAPAAPPIVARRMPADERSPALAGRLVEAGFAEEPLPRASPEALTLALPLVRARDGAPVADPTPGLNEEQQVQYVTGSSVNVRFGPSAETEALTKLARGEAVLVLPSATPGWSMIRIEGDGVEGYIASRFLGSEP